MSNELKHYGVKGMKWGVRKDRRIPTVFISGSSKTQNRDSEWYRKELPRSIRAKVNSYIKAHKRIIIGDAPGIDTQVQNYLKRKGYKNVIVYSTGKARYKADSDWKNRKVKSNAPIGSKEYLAAKDSAMRSAATEGLAVVIPNGASATRNNIADLIKNQKSVSVIELGDKENLVMNYDPSPEDEKHDKNIF